MGNTPEIEELKQLVMQKYGRGETRTSPFVAGRNGGLTIINVIGDKK